jgi:hypothetical protein
VPRKCTQSRLSSLPTFARSSHPDCNRTLCSGGYRNPDLGHHPSHPMLGMALKHALYIESWSKATLLYFISARQQSAQTAHVGSGTSCWVLQGIQSDWTARSCMHRNECTLATPNIAPDTCTAWAAAQPVSLTGCLTPNLVVLGA